MSTVGTGAVAAHARLASRQRTTRSMEVTLRALIVYVSEIITSTQSSQSANRVSKVEGITMNVQLVFFQSVFCKTLFRWI